VNCPGEPFACYLCQGDDVDPYCELEEACDECGGDGGHAYPVDIDRRDGSLIEHWRTCDACEATGSVPILCQPIGMDDLAEI
jgi:DnaJ-class molecular chaperone